MSKSNHLPEHIIDQACDWLVVLHSGEMSETEQEQFQQWLAADPQHAAAIEQFSQLSQGLAQLPQPLIPQQILKTHQQLDHQLKQHCLYGFMIFMTVAGLLYQLPWAIWQADQHSAMGEVKQLKLEDGTELTLASNSYINIHYDSNHREIELLQGEIYITTGKDPQHRPFKIKTREGQIEALGTQFTVRQQSQSSQLQVYQHAVAVSPQALKQRYIIQQGQATQFSAHKLEPLTKLNLAHPDWTQHMLLVENRPLFEVMDELYRYRSGQYLLADELKNISVSGVFSLKNIQQSLESIAYTHQLELKSYTPYLLHITAKKASAH